MATLHKALKRKINGSTLKSVVDYDTLSTGINYAENKQTIWIGDHVVMLKSSDVDFLIKHLAQNKKALDQHNS